MNEARRLEEIAREQFEIVYRENEELRQQVKDLQGQLTKPVVEVIKPARPKHKKGWSDATRRKYEGEGNE